MMKSRKMNNNIWLQFLSESVVICTVGGLIGVIIGIINGVIIGKVAMMFLEAVLSTDFVAVFRFIAVFSNSPPI